MMTALNRREIGFSHEAPFRHHAAPVFVSLRPPATVAAWHPARLCLAGGRRRFALSTAPPAPGFTHARGTAEAKFLPAHRQPAAARIARDSLCLPGQYRTDSGRTAAPPNISAVSFGVNRPGCA